MLSILGGCILKLTFYTHIVEKLYFFLLWNTKQDILKNISIVLLLEWKISVNI